MCSRVCRLFRTLLLQSAAYVAGVSGVSPAELSVRSQVVKPQRREGGSLGV